MTTPIMDEINKAQEDFISRVMKSEEDRLIARIQEDALNPMKHSIKELRDIMYAKSYNIKLRIHPLVCREIADKLEEIMNNLNKEDKSCSNCCELRIINTDEIYAVCPATSKVFVPWKTGDDTRECKCGRWRKAEDVPKP